MAFISYNKMLPDATKGEQGSKGGGGQMRLSNVDIGRLTGFKYKLICRFKLAADMVGVACRIYIADESHSVV